MGGGTAPSGRYKPKRHRQSSDYQCLFLFLGSVFPVSSGAGGSRTPVQTCCKDAFYTFSLRLLVGAWQVRDQPTPRLSSEFRSRIEACARYPSFYDTSDRTPGGGGLPGKHPVPRTLSGLRNSPRLGSESIGVAIYWLRELVFNGTVSQPPTCLQIHIHAVKTKRPQWIYFSSTLPDVFKMTRSVSAFDITVTHLLMRPGFLAV